MIKDIKTKSKDELMVLKAETNFQIKQLSKELNKISRKITNKWIWLLFIPIVGWIVFYILLNKEKTCEPFYSENKNKKQLLSEKELDLIVINTMLENLSNKIN